MQISALNNPVDQTAKTMPPQAKADAKIETDAKTNVDAPVAAKGGNEELGSAIDALA